MASSLPNIILKRFASRSLSKLLGGSLYNYGLRFSTTVPNDPNTHDDFKPTNKLENYGISLKDVVEQGECVQDVKDNPIMVYMKGVPKFPQCGFSSLAVKVLQQYGVRARGRNYIEDFMMCG